MKKTEKKKITLKKDQAIDLNGAQSFIDQGANSVPVKETPKKEKPVKNVYPWENETLDLKKLTQVPTVSIPLEYALKLEYIRQQIGFTKQSVCRNAIIERIDQILDEHIKK